MNPSSMSLRAAPKSAPALGLLLLALLGSGCSWWRARTLPPPAPGPVGETRRVEESVERTAVIPAAPVEEPPRRVTSVSTSWPLAAASPDSQPISALARGTGAAARRELVYALAVPFPAGAAALTAPARSILDQLVARLNLGDSVFYLEIQGHADASGTDVRNMAIALERAQKVRDYLVVASGLPAERLALVSLGAGQPVGDNATPDGRARNRRVVVLVLR
jgi:outer membrane protein OmpA-like peptidoglycan-associated protein